MVLLREARTWADADLVEQCRRGDTTAFDEIVLRYKGRVFNVVCRFLGNREDSLDVALETFVRAFNGLGDFRGSASLSTWLYSIAANLARNRLRDASRKGRDQGVALDEVDQAIADHPGENPRTLAEGAELNDVLQRCLDELPEVCRQAFVLRVFEDLSYRDIAQALGCPEGTVKSRISQARKLLRDRLHELALV